MEGLGVEGLEEEVLVGLYSKSLTCCCSISC